MKHQLVEWPPDGTKKCSHCKGSGKYRGLFSYGDCAHCDGSGLCDSHGNRFSPCALIPLLRRHIDKQRSKHAALLNTPGVQEAINNAQERAEQERLGYGMINIRETEEMGANHITASNEWIDPRYVQISKKEAASIIGVSVSDFDKRRSEDPECPQGFKRGAARSAPVYFRLSDVYAYSEVVIDRAMQSSA